MTPVLNSIPRSPTRRRWLAVFGLVVVMLILPCSSAVDPHLYSAKDASTTGFHQDLAATGGQSRADAELVLEEWATSLNLSGSLIHNIKLRDFKFAARDLQQSLLVEQKFKDLVFLLDMTDTDAATFRDDNHANIESFRGLLNQTREFDELGGVEATFRYQKNISGLMSVELRGEDLRAKIRSNYKEYAGRSGRVVTISRKFGLDTSAFEQSVNDFAAILAEIDAIQNARSAAISELIQDYQTASVIRLNILPDHGVYGDTLSMAGTANAPIGAEVKVFVDGLQAGSVPIDNSGRFSLPYRIEQVEVGNHTVYASIDSDISDISNFTVKGGNTTISLTVLPVEENGTRMGIGTGRLLAEDGVPVREARVSVSIDGRASWEYGMTGDDGVYTLTTEQLSPGTHTLKARFDPGGFPLDGSESPPVTIEGPPSVGWFASLVYLVAIGGAAVGGVLFLRGRHATDAPPSSDTMAASARPAESSSIPTIEEARMIADEVTVINEGQIDGGETMALTYRRLVKELDAKNPDLRLRSRTPRNLAVLFADRPYSDQLGVLVGIHEKIRYAEHEPTEEDIRLVREAFINIITEGSVH